MQVRAEFLDHYPKLTRLIARVEAMQLHVAAGESCAQAWLIQWLNTPFAELDGRKPAHFLDYPDYDLILVGLLVQLRSRHAWQTEPTALS